MEIKTIEINSLMIWFLIALVWIFFYLEYSNTEILNKINTKLTTITNKINNIP